VIEASRRSLERATAIGVEEFKRGLGGLATIGSTSPFVGLFGTTIGIINAFQGMKTEETAGIAAVAGGIAEALVTTAFGLFVAVPAVSISGWRRALEHLGTSADVQSLDLLRGGKTPWGWWDNPSGRRTRSRRSSAPAD
jgi:biopolymer transport protein ExbB/TolQ